VLEVIGFFLLRSIKNFQEMTASIQAGSINNVLEVTGTTFCHGIKNVLKVIGITSWRSINVLEVV